MFGMNVRDNQVMFAGCGRPISPGHDKIYQEATMTIPANAIENEIHHLIQFQIDTFGQPVPLNSSQLQEHHQRAEIIRNLGQELDRIGTLRVVEQFRKAA
jgi:hypothetical protein